jgi:hypothetical protein
MEVRLEFTPIMRRELTRRVLQMLEKSVTRFPELQGKMIAVGHTRSNLGAAILPRKGSSQARCMIRLKAKGLTYNTIGHELTHLTQGLSQVSRSERHKGFRSRIPGGEKQCDIWTLARSDLFCDDPPTYLKLPRRIAENWPEYAREVRALCQAAIRKRGKTRLYIRWLEEELKRLGREPRKEQGNQGNLPFGG